MVATDQGPIARASPADGSFEGHVVVITGASSGIGRLAALEFARRGALVVAAARNERGLQSLVKETETLKGRLLPIVADVAERADVDRIAAGAIEAHGRIDTWINNAGVMVYATVEDTDLTELRQVFDVNLIGVFNGLQAALAVMRRQGSGTIITIGSVESLRALPLQGAYAASKHAVKGLVEALRVEIAEEGLPIAIVLVEPSYVNTPLFDHARSRIGSRPRPLPPLYQPEAVVEALLHVAQKPVGEVVVGGFGKALTLLERLNPSLVDRALLVGGIGFRGQRDEEPESTEAAPAGDNLFSPVDESGRTHGRWDSMSLGSSWYTRTVGLHPRVRQIGLGTLLALGGLVALRRR